MKKKKVLHCVCGLPTQTFRKGKGHRVIICPRCGIIATNPIPLLLAGASLLAPVAKELVSTGLKKLGRTAVEKVGESFSNDTARTGATSISRVTTDSKDRPNIRERIVNRELYGA